MYCVNVISGLNLSFINFDSTPAARTPYASMPPSPEFTIAEVSATSVIAQGLGYVIGAGSLLLYTPIAIRVCRQRDASGLTLSTWWLKLISYTCSDVYSFANGYLVSTCVALVAALHTFPCSLSGT